jgi:alpha-beta hydrolase superfamily lysophospholipase
MDVDRPRAGFLLLHGLSDSPYSLMPLARRLHEEGACVVGLRLPGHGTAPAGLTRVSWHDFTAAVRLAARHLTQRIGPQWPLYLVGYSNGAALSLEYALSVLEGEDLPVPAGLVLISPAVAVTPAASLARWLLWLSRLPGLEKLAWLDIAPEYDPYKYNSFALNAGDQISRLTVDLRSRIERLDHGNGVSGFPPVLSFVSAVDDTVSASAVVNQLMVRLAPEGHQLVVFDVNREAETALFLSSDPGPSIKALLNQNLSFDLTLVTNRNPRSRWVKAVRKQAGQTTLEQEDLDMAWPASVYSLSHVALPFPADDPLYGDGRHAATQGITLGSLEPRGERNLLRVKSDDLLRLRYNPFYHFLEHQVLARFLTDHATDGSSPGFRTSQKENHR